MKTIILYAIACYAFTACSTNKDASDITPGSLTVSALFDITEPLQCRLTADQLLEQFHCEKYPKASFSFRLSSISDKIQNECIKFNIAGAEPSRFSLDIVKDQERSEAILKFYGAVRKGVSEFYARNDTSKSLDRSVCSQVILNELQYLAENKNDQTTLVIASDLRENSDLNTYTLDSINPKKIAEWLESINPNVPSLKDITVLFVFTSKNQEEDRAFYAIVQGYKVFLESKGATVKIQANL
jgi:hypothetical protein